LKFSNCRKEVCGYAKVKVLKKMDKYPNKVKKRKKEEDSPYSLAKVFKFQTRETCFRRA
jgi:hypothetical protein